MDNGTHLMIGGYTRHARPLRRAGAADLLLVQDDLRIDYVDDRGLVVARLPAAARALHLLAGPARLRLPWRGAPATPLRFGLAARFGRPPAGLTLAE